MIATTIEQSKHLLELGLDPKTADMVWMFNKWLYSIKDNILNREQFSEQDTLAWSLSALLEVIPAMIVHPTWVDKRPTDVWFNFDKDYNRETKKQFYVCYYKSLDTHQLAKMTEPSHSSPIDAAYEMVCWLLEHGLIEKGEQNE